MKSLLRTECCVEAILVYKILRFISKEDCTLSYKTSAKLNVVGLLCVKNILLAVMNLLLRAEKMQRKLWTDFTW